MLYPTYLKEETSIERWPWVITSKVKRSKFINHAIIFYKSNSKQGSVGSYWWYGWRRRNCNDHLEWYSKRLGILYPGNLLKKKTNQVSTVMGRMCSIRRNNSSQRRKYKWKWGSILDIPYQRKEQEKELWPSSQKESRVIILRNTSQIMTASLVIRWDTFL